MKTRVIFFVCCIVLQVIFNGIEARAIAEVEREKFLTLLSHEEKICVNNLHLNEDHILQLNNEDVTTEDDDEYNRFLECYWKDQGIQDKNGKVNYKVLSTLMQQIAADELKDEDDFVISIVQGLAKGAVDHCEKQAPIGNSHGQTCVKTQNCIMSKLLKNIEDL